MLGTRLQRGGHAKQRIFVHARRGIQQGHACQHGFARGEGACLVHGQHADMPGLLQGSAVLDQHAKLRAPPRAHHDGHGRGKTHGARAGHDQHSHKNRQRRCYGFRAEHKPCKGRHKGNNHDGGHEIKAYPVGQTGDGGLAALSLAHQSYDAGKAGVAAHSVSHKGQRTFAINAASRQLVPRPDGYRDGFAREQRQIKSAFAGQHGAVNGHAPARTQQQMIAHAHLCQRCFFRRGGCIVRVEPQGCFRRQAHERAHGVASAPLGNGLQILPEFDHGQQHGAGFIIQVHGAGHGFAARKPKQGVAKAEQKSRARAHGHKAVHGRGLAQEGLYAVHIKMAAQPHHGQGEYKLRQHEGAWREVRIKRLRQWQAEHVPHGDNQQRCGKGNHGQQTAQTGLNVCRGSGLAFFKLAGGVIVRSWGSAEPKCGHALHYPLLQVAVLPIARPHFSAGRSQVHADFFHPFHAAHNPFNA